MGGYALWFIPVLFLSSILSKIIWRSESRYAVLFLGVALAVLGGILKSYSISLPWTFSSVPYASFLLILGSLLSKYREYIEMSRWWLAIICFFLTGFVSYNWRLDIAWNSILPIVPLTIGALSGTMMIFILSSFIMQKSKWLTKLFVSVGKETYLIMAFSKL